MEKFGFFNDIDDDRVYFSEDFARYFSQFFTNGIFNNGCKVKADNNNMTINVESGSANINGYRYDNDSIKTLTIETADGVLNRIDNIVIRLDLINRNITAQVIKGTYANNPVAPSLTRTSTVYDLRIATISIPAGITGITQDLVTDTRFLNSDCGNVVSAVQTPDTEDIFLEYQKKFDKFFNDIKNKLSEDQAGNLQLQLDNLDVLGLKEFLYDNTKTYVVGDQVLMNKKIYECTEVTSTEYKWKELGPIFVPDDFEPSATVVSTPKPTN